MNGVRGSKRVNPINNLKVYSYVSMESRDKSSKGTPTTSGNSKAEGPQDFGENELQQGVP